MDKTLLHTSFFRDFSTRQNTKVYFSLLSLCIGGLIYIGLRERTLLMFEWFDHLGLTRYIDIFRSMLNSEGVYDWVKNSFPDGLWLFAYMFLVDAIWNGSKSISAYIFIYYLPFLALMSEILQFFGLVQEYLTGLILSAIYLQFFCII